MSVPKPSAIPTPAPVATNVKTYCGAGTGIGAANVSEQVAVGSTLYFTSDSPFSGSDKGCELWSSDEPGATQVIDIRAGTESSNPSSLTLSANRLLFLANDGTNGLQIWEAGDANGPRPAWARRSRSRVRRRGPIRV